MESLDTRQHAKGLDVGDKMVADIQDIPRKIDVAHIYRIFQEK
jgi:predicted CoA-binding protein